MTETADVPAAAKRRFRAGVLIKNALALMFSTGGTALLGVVFWGLSTHLATAATVGRASAEIAAMTLLANLAQLSFGPIFERFLPVAGSRTFGFVARAYLACVCVALLIAVVYVTLGFSRSFIPSSFGWRALFVAAVVMWTLFVLQDSVLIGLRAARWVPVENILFAVGKLALLPVFIAISSTEGVFLAWTTPVAGAIYGVTRFLVKKGIPRHAALGDSSEDLPATREILFLASAQYASLLLNVVSSSLVALIVIERLGAVANAHYYLPALIATGPALLLWNLVTSFLVEASADPSKLRSHARVTVRAAIVVLIPSVVVGEVFAPDILRIFGATYATHGTTLLRMLVAALPATTVTAFYYSLAWIDKRVWWLAVRELISATVYFSLLFAFIDRLGILAVGIAALSSSGAQAIFFLPVSIRRYRSFGHEVAADQARPTPPPKGRRRHLRHRPSATQRAIARVSRQRRAPRHRKRRHRHRRAAG